MNASTTTRQSAAERREEILEAALEEFAAHGYHGASTEARRLAGAIERGIAAGRLDLLSADALQALIAAACRSYAARRQAGEEFTPVAKSTVSATDVMITASGLLKAADLSTFELGMWQGFTGR